MVNYQILFILLHNRKSQRWVCWGGFMAQPGHQEANIAPSFSSAIPSLLLFFFFLSLGLSLHGCKMTVAAPGITFSQGNIQSGKPQAPPPACFLFLFLSRCILGSSYTSLVSTAYAKGSKKVPAIFNFYYWRATSLGRKEEEGSGCCTGDQQCLP